MKATSIEQIREHLAKGGRVLTARNGSGVWEAEHAFRSGEIQCRSGASWTIKHFACHHWELLPVKEEKEKMSIPVAGDIKTFYAVMGFKCHREYLIQGISVWWEIDLRLGKRRLAMSERLYCVLWRQRFCGQTFQTTSWFHTESDAEEFADRLRQDGELVIKSGSVVLETGRKEATGDE